jgi:hypothetical protein
MAFDLLLGITKKNWSRGAMPPALALPPAEPAIECTAREKAGLEKMASIKMRAEAGDRQAKIQWIAVASKFRATKARAKAGDPKARRSLAILQQAGFLQPTQKFSFSSGEQASLDDAWGQVKAYGNAVEKKDAKAARDSIEWMILRGWKASGSAGSFPFYTKIAWANASLPGKKIAFSTTGSAYAVAIVSGEGARTLVGDSIPHDTYRAAVMLTAIKDANGSRPTTKDIFAAKAKVDNKLGNMGVSIYLPGARPARRTY